MRIEGVSCLMFVGFGEELRVAYEENLLASENSLKFEI